jgi:hypothetical protein
MIVIAGNLLKEIFFEEIVDLVGIDGLKDEFGTAGNEGFGSRLFR